MNVFKWCLNRPKQAKVMQELFEFAGMRDKPSHYKPLRDIQIKRSEKCVGEVIEILEEGFLNPFGVDVEQDKVYITSAQDSNIKVVQMILLESEQWVKRCSMISKKIACSLQPLNSTTQSNAKSRRCSVMLAKQSQAEERCQL